MANDRTSIFDETEEMDWASRLLELNEPQALTRFLQRMQARVERIVGRPTEQSARHALVGILRNAAARALPVLRPAIRGAAETPRARAALSMSTTAAGERVFGLELEGLSPEDREFEVARRFVRYAGEVFAHAATSGAERKPSAAVAAAAKRHAPGMLGRERRREATREPGGTWVRRAGTIVLLDV